VLYRYSVLGKLNWPLLFTDAHSPTVGRGDKFVNSEYEKTAGDIILFLFQQFT
jgi:hypothetical protein